MRAIDRSQDMPGLDQKKRKTIYPKPRIRTRATCAREPGTSTTNVMLFEQRLVTRLVFLLDVIEKRTARRYELQETATRMVVLHVGLEVPGEVIDAFRQDRDLNLGRAGVARLGGIRLDDFRFAFGGNRHRQTLSFAASRTGSQSGQVE